MKLLLKILFFVLAIFQANISEAKVFVFDRTVSEKIFPVNDKENTNELTVFLENDFGITWKSKNKLVNYGILVVGVETAAVKGAVNLLKPLGLGSTGRTVANNLVEQMTMKNILNNPTLGKVVMTGMKDSRWFGWSKMQYTVTSENGIKFVIHYVGKFENGILKAVDDFKFN